MSPHRAEAFAPAKINLTLHVTGQRADGYHLLDSLVVFADFGDRVRVRRGDGLSLDVTGPMAQGVPVDDSNLVLRAARAAGLRDAAITLEKHLPSAAGIGGGSSDAAALLRAAGSSPADQGLSLGADVPVCMLARAARMRGIGEDVALVADLPELPAVLVNPRVSVSTPQVFAALETRNGAPMPDVLPDFAGLPEFSKWLRVQRNDLEAPARSLQPVIGTALLALREAGATLARMSGSGATVFGLFADRDAAQQAADRVAHAHPDWWVRAVALR